MGEILRLATDPANSTIDLKKANINALCVHLQGALRFHTRVKMVICLDFSLNYSGSYRIIKYHLTQIVFFFYS